MTVEQMILRQQENFGIEMKSMWKRIDRLTVLTTAIAVVLLLREGVSLTGLIP